MPAQRRNRKAISKNAVKTPSENTTRTQSETANSESTVWDEQSRATSTHVFFWGGHLSNFHLGPKYSGSRALTLLLPELQRLNAPHPPTNTFVTRLIQDHKFICGEQWMMTMKSWFFETDLELGNQIVITTYDKNSSDDDNETNSTDITNQMSDQQFQTLKSAMYSPKPHQSWPHDSPERKMWSSTTCQILRTQKPRDQKALGRKVRGFDETVWSAVNMACVLAACIARAEVDPALRRMYMAGVSEGLGFVEGSPRDRIWGVGLHWMSEVIEDPANWNGENRLGVCHDRAAGWVREMVDAGLLKDGTKERR